MVTTCSRFYCAKQVGVLQKERQVVVVVEGRGLYKRDTTNNGALARDVFSSLVRTVLFGGLCLLLCLNLNGGLWVARNCPGRGQEH